MQLKCLVSLFFGFLAIMGCNNSNKFLIENDVLLYDSSRIAILPFDTSKTWVPKNSISIKLRQNDIKVIDSLLESAVKNYNSTINLSAAYAEVPKDFRQPKYFLIDVKDYRRQYLAFIDNNNQKFVLVNCFCDQPSPNWKHYMRSVKDGGKCYFNLIINLTTRNYFDFYVNGAG